ncbi:MAG: ribbon-helix-helix protein, CopG family [Rhodospirillaceae bacterium]
MTKPKRAYRTERLQIMLDEEELKAIEEWRYDMRLPSRSAAIRELLRIGLDTKEKAEQADIQAKSTDFTVLPDAEK